MPDVESLKAAAIGWLSRRSAVKRAGLGLAGAALAGATGAGGLLAPRPAKAASTLTDADVFNFALNLEYLEAEFYLRAVSGRGIPSTYVTGVGTQGGVTGGAPVPFQSGALFDAAARIAFDELGHVLFIRSALGSAAVAEPAIDLQTSFTTAAQAAGLIQPGATFNPFADELSFLIGAYIFEDVGVSAYAGAAAALTNPANLSYAASILGVEGYHAGAIRDRLGTIGQTNAFATDATVAIAALRAKLSGVPDVGTLAYGNANNFTDVDSSGLAFRRTPQQVLAIVYGGGTSKGLFFPNGVNGTITTVATS